MSGATQEYRAKVQALRDALAAYSQPAEVGAGQLDPGEYPLAEAVIDAAAEVLDALDAAEADWSAEVAGLQDQRAALISERMAMQRERDAWQRRAGLVEQQREDLLRAFLQIADVTRTAVEGLRERVQRDVETMTLAADLGEWVTVEALVAEYDPVRDGIPSCPTDRQHVLTQDGPGWWCTGCAIGVVPVFTRLEPVTAPADPPAPCQRCSGEGQIANTEDGEAWSSWASLPPGSDLAVQLGLVQPIPCPACTGTGRRG